MKPDTLPIIPMTKRFGILLILLVAVSALAGLKHFARPLWSPLVATARGEETVASVVSRLREKEIGLEEEQAAEIDSLTLIGLKEERSLEVWAHRPGTAPDLIRTYPFTAYSGKLGPKLREGDLQIPEGIYEVAHLNPNSSYHLSIKIDYPNAFDRKKGEVDGRDTLGGDIFIHGRAVTIGCIPIGDEAIEDLFLIVAQIGLGNTNVVIAPFDFRIRAECPEIEEIAWEEELYGKINEAMKPFTRPPAE